MAYDVACSTAIPNIWIRIDFQPTKNYGLCFVSTLYVIPEPHCISPVYDVETGEVLRGRPHDRKLFDREKALSFIPT